MDFVHDRAIIVAEEDRISNLSDDIIHRILSSVDMKYAIRTSKISRRWRHIWKTMPHLKINTHEFHDLLQFAKFMKHALSHRNNSALVSSVNLTFRGSPTQFPVKSIVKYALSHNVKQLTMRQEHHTVKSLEYPQFLFSSRTLKILTLTGLSSKWSHTSCFVPESGWDFPSLETLNLRNIHITGETDKSVNPFSKCVNLKNLTLNRLLMDKKWIFIIDAPQLSNLTMTNAISFPEVIHVVAPQLQNLTATLTASGYWSKLQFLTEGFNSLEKVELSVCSSTYGKTYVPRDLLLDMFHKVCSATVLVLDQHIIEAISSHLDEFSREPCPFNNLKCLKVHGVSCYPIQAKNYLLENSPSATFIMDSPQVSQKRSREPVPDDGMANKVAKLDAENKQAEITDEEKRTLQAKVPNQGEVIETQLGYLMDTAPTRAPSPSSPSSVNDGDTFVDETRYKQVDGNLEDDCEEVEVVMLECWQYFDEVYKNESGGLKKKYGKCKHCKKLIKADQIINDGKHGLKHHLKSCEVNPEVRANKQKQANLVFDKDTSGEGGSSVNVWRHDELAIKEALLDFFVCAEVPFKLVEHWAFVRLVNQLNGKVKLPSRHNLSKDIATYYIEERSKLFVYLSDPKTTVHLTTDTWTSSCQKVNYMVVTAHFIDENWVMHKRIINFRPIESHKGDDIGFELLRCINDWGIQNVMTMTLDNASSNDKAIEYLLKNLPNLYDQGKHFYVRCMAHILNLIVKDGLCNQRYHVECVQKAIRYIRHLTQRITKFKECMKKEKLESEKFLCLDCPTRWNSTYEMLKIAVGLQKVFQKYESVDPCYQCDLERIPDCDDFDACEKMVLFLEEFKDKMETVFITSKPLSHLFLREVLEVDNHLRVWETDVRFCNMVRQMRENFDKYWGRFDKLNDYFYFAVILDPTMKSVFVRHCFRAIITNAISEENPMSKTFIEKMVGVLVGAVENRLGKLFETYQARFDTAGSGSQQARNEEDAVKSQGKNDFFANYLHVEGHTSVAMETELIRYLHEPEVNFEPGFDILKWWSLNGNRFPIVAHMARDILAIQISSVSSESAFSTVGCVLDPYRTRLSTNILEALICTQDWVRKSSNSIYMDQVDDILNDDDIAIEIEEAINNQKDKGKEPMLVEE